MSIIAALALLSVGQGKPVSDKAVFRENPYRRFQTKDLATVKVTINDKHEFNLWVMDSDAKREEGMMFLEAQDFTEKQGMLFVFKSGEPLRFWMKNTFVPLDIAYVTPAKKIDSIYTMAAFDTTTDYSSAQACMYTIEVKDGLWKKLGVKVGDRITIRPAVRAKD